MIPCNTNEQLAYKIQTRSHIAISGHMTFPALWRWWGHQGRNAHQVAGSRGTGPLSVVRHSCSCIFAMWPHLFIIVLARQIQLYNYLDMFMERGSSVVEWRTRNQVSPGLNPPYATVLKFGHFHSLHDASVTQLYKWVPGYRQWWKCEWIGFAHDLHIQYSCTCWYVIGWRCWRVPTVYWQCCPTSSPLSLHVQYSCICSYVTDWHCWKILTAY